MPNAYIRATGGYVPPKVVTNEDFARDYNIDTNHEWIFQRTGIEERRYADVGVTTSDMALAASKAALTQAGMVATDLDMILFATLSPDYSFPGSGVFLQEKLGLLEGESPKFVPAMDIRNQCSGFLYGLTTANAMVRSGQANNILLVGAEKHSAALDFSTRGRSVTSLFGDGAGAVIVSATDEDRGIRQCWLGADGRHAKALWMKTWDISQRTFVPLDAEGNAHISAEDMWPQMNGKIVFRNAVEKMIGVVMQACWEHKITTEDVDLWCFHQANKRINEYIAEQLGLPADRVVHNIERYGNTTAATIPLLLAEAERNGKLTRGKKVMMVAFGSGFTWGGALVDW